MAKEPLDDDQRQQFLDDLPDAQVNPNAEQTFDGAISRAAQPTQSVSETPAPSDDCSDTQTCSDTAGDTSGSHSDTSRR